jgi:hypothetical protein
MGARISRPGPSPTSLPSSECSRSERPGPLVIGPPSPSPARSAQGPERPGEQGGGHSEAAAPPAIGAALLATLTNGKAICNTR